MTPRSSLGVAVVLVAPLFAVAAACSGEDDTPGSSLGATGGPGGAGGTSSSVGVGGRAGAGACSDAHEPNDDVATATALADLLPDPDFPDECGGAFPQQFIEGSLGVGDVDYFTAEGKERTGKLCSHTPKIYSLEKAPLAACIFARCVTGTLDLDCKGTAKKAVEGQFQGCCGNVTDNQDVGIDRLDCVGATTLEATMLVRIELPPGETVCRAYRGGFFF